MFDNVGGKIKDVALVFCWIGIIVSVICAIVVWANGDDWNPTFWPGLGVLVGGCLFSWLGSLGVYGFGELIENTTEILSLMQKKNATSTKNKKSTVNVKTNQPDIEPEEEEFLPDDKELSDEIWLCKKCASVNNMEDDHCTICGTSK